MSLDVVGLLSSPLFISGAILGAVLALFGFALLGRAPVRFFIPILKLLAWPFRMLLRLLWRTGLLKRRVAQAGSEGATRVKRRPDQSETDFALLQVDGASHVDLNSQYDFRLEHKMLSKRGPLLNAYDEIKSDYLPDHLSGTFTSEIADSYLEEATRFFSASVNIEADKDSLYDDAESAFVVSLFRSVDRRFYYLLQEMRKTINGNARKLGLYLSLLMVSSVILTLLFFLGLPWQFLPCTTMFYASSVFSCQDHYIISPPKLPDIFYDYENPYFWYVIFSFAFALLMWVMQGWYSIQQDRNSRTLHTFLSWYFSRVANRYREAMGYAKQVTVGDETDSQKTSTNAKRWHKIMMWIPFRAFHMECFIRNFLYQIHRNTGYYHYIPWISWFILLVPLINVVLITDLLEHNLPAALFFGVTVAVSSWYFHLVQIPVIATKLSHLDWQGFEQLDVSTTMDEVVGKYAEEVSYWKGRLGRS